MDYCFELTNKCVIFEKQEYESLLYRMELEANNILENLNSVSVIFEESLPTSKIKSFLDRLKEFFKNLFNIFRKKISEKIRNNTKWFEENKSIFDQIDYSKLKIEMLPYWEANIENLISSLPSMQNVGRSDIIKEEKVKELSNFQSFKEHYFNKYLDNNNDLTNGLKNYFRVGNSKGKTNESISGAKLKELVPSFISFCENFNKKTFASLDKMRADKEREIAGIESIIKSRPSTESFCLIENTFINESDLSYWPKFQTLFEAEISSNEKKENQEGVKAGEKDDEKQSPTKVNVSSSDNNNEDKKTDYSSFSSPQLDYIKNMSVCLKTAVTAAMTAAENKYDAYFSALKLILTESGVNKKNNTQSKEPINKEKTVKELHENFNK